MYERVVSIETLDLQNECKVVLWFWTKEGKIPIFYDYTPKIYIREQDINKVFGVPIKTDYKTMKGEPVYVLSFPTYVRRRDYLKTIPDIETFESDINGKDDWVIDEKIDFKHDVQIAYIDIETSMIGNQDDGDARILCIGGIDNHGNEFYADDNDEIRLIKKFNNWMKYHTIFVSWSEYDWNYLQKRTKWLKKRGYLRYDDIKYIFSCQFIDLMQYFGFVYFKSNSMFTNFVKLHKACEILGIPFEDMGVKGDYTVIDKLFKENKPELKKYNMQDVRVLKIIDEKYNFVKNIKEITDYFKLPLKYIQSNSKMIDILTLRLAHKDGIVLPSKNFDITEVTSKYAKGNDSENSEKLNKKVGAFVIPPRSDWYNYVVCLDFKSLYPSIMTTFNIGIDSMLPDDYSGDNCHNTAHKKFKKEPTCLNNRVVMTIKQLLSKYSEELDNTDPKSQKYNELYLKRYRTKILANSDFGVFGYEKYRLYNKDAFESVTKTGQLCLLTLTEIVKDMGYFVIYGDTDSVFVHLGKDMSLDELKQLVEVVNKEFDKRLTEKLGTKLKSHIDFEYFASRFFITKSKKRYCAKLKYDGEFESNKIKVMGFEVKRRDWCVLAKELQNWILNKYMEGYDNKTIIPLIKQKLQEIHRDLYSGKLDDKIILTKSVNPNKQYKNYNIPHLRAMKELKKLNPHTQVKDINYYIIKWDNKELITLPVESNPKIEKSGYDYIWEKQLFAIVRRMYIDIPMDVQQTTLSSFF